MIFFSRVKKLTRIVSWPSLKLTTWGSPQTRSLVRSVLRSYHFYFQILRHTTIVAKKLFNTFTLCKIWTLEKHKTMMLIAKDVQSATVKRSIKIFSQKLFTTFTFCKIWTLEQHITVRLIAKDVQYATAMKRNIKIFSQKLFISFTFCAIKASKSETMPWCWLQFCKGERLRQWGRTSKTVDWGGKGYREGVDDLI